MCVIEQRTYIQPDGRKETFEHVKSRCPLAGAGRSCRQTTYEERTMHGLGHSRHSPRVTYADESSSLPSPATESFPPTPVNGATVIDVTPSSAGLSPAPSPKHHRKSASYGKIVFKFGSKEKPKPRTKRYHGSSAVSEATSEASIRSHSPAPPSPLSATLEPTFTPAHQYSHRRSQSASTSSRPSMPYTTSTRIPARPDSRGREEHHFLSPQSYADPHAASPLTPADPPRGPPGPPRPPAPPAAADPPSPEEPGRRRHRRPAPPPIVTQPSQGSGYRTTSAAPSHAATTRSHNNRPDASSQTPNDPVFVERLSASLHSLRMNEDRAQPRETEDERLARIDRERAEGRERLRQERIADEYWARYHREREERREEGRRNNEQQRRPAEDWEVHLEEGRRRLEHDHANRPPTGRHDPSIDAQPNSSGDDDDDWEAQLEAGRRRLADLKRTEEATNNARTTRERHPSHPSASQPRRSNTTTGTSHNQRNNYRSPQPSPDSSSNPTATNSSTSGSNDNEAAERARLYAFEEQHRAFERSEADNILAAEIADTQADIARAEERLAARRNRHRAYTLDPLSHGLPNEDLYNPRLGMGVGGGGLRHGNRRLAPVDLYQQQPPLGGDGLARRESGRQRGHRVVEAATRRGMGGRGDRSAEERYY